MTVVIRQTKVSQKKKITIKRRISMNSSAVKILLKGFTSQLSLYFSTLEVGARLKVKKNKIVENSLRLRKLKQSKKIKTIIKKFVKTSNAFFFKNILENNNNWKGKIFQTYFIQLETKIGYNFVINYT